MVNKISNTCMFLVTTKTFEIQFNRHSKARDVAQVSEVKVKIMVAKKAVMVFL